MGRNPPIIPISLILSIPTQTMTTQTIPTQTNTTQTNTTQTMTTQTNTTRKLKSLIKSTKGKFFSITFIKKDGTKRTINGKDKYIRLLAESRNKKGGRAMNADAEYTAFVNRNRETWVCAKDDCIIQFKCGDQKIFEI